MVAPSDIRAAGILVVDDQPANVRLLTRTLAGAGYTNVSATTDPTAVLGLHRQHRYDLVLLDLAMPVLDGFGVMAQLKEVDEPVQLPVLVITAERAHRVRALEAGARDFVDKPFDRAELLVRVHNLVEARLLQREVLGHSAELERQVIQLEASRDLIQDKEAQVRGLYETVLAEQKRSVELSLQPGAMVGVEKEERLGTPWPRSLRLRHPWLQVNLLTAFAAAAVVGLFQGTINRLLLLTIFLPVIAGQSGNTGSQALAITLRGLALGDLQAGRERDLVRKEALLGLLNGALVGAVAAAAMYAVAASQDSPSAALLGGVVFLAMMGSCLVSGICGAVVPLLLKRFGADPSIASSIFLTTATDVASMGMLLGLAAVLVP